MFYKIIASLLSATVLLSIFAACAKTEEKDFIDPAISATTSGTDEYAVWLTERLETIPNDVTLVIGGDDNNLYCVCARCMDLLSEELSLSGGLLRFANCIVPVVEDGK